MIDKLAEQAARLDGYGLGARRVPDYCNNINAALNFARRRGHRVNLVGAAGARFDGVDLQITKRDGTRTRAIVRAVVKAARKNG